MNASLAQEHSDQEQRERSRQKKSAAPQLANARNNPALSVLQKNREEQQPPENKQEDDDDEIDMFAEEELAEDLFKGTKNMEAEVTDQSGYYNVVVGTILNNKYKILEKLGRGVFGVVVKCELIQLSDQADQKSKQEAPEETQKYFAVKILRKNQHTERSGQRQYKILQKIHSSGPSVNKHINTKDAKLNRKIKRIMKVYDYFVESGHLCLVCELLSTDLNSYIHKKQPTLDDIRLLAISMFLISHELRISKVIHADIKPDNFMFRDPPVLTKKTINENQQKQDKVSKLEEKMIIDNLRLVDFGTSFWVDEHSNQVEYQVARYYRAPEIILGTQVKPSQVYALDVWSIACTLYEIYAGQFLFTGSSNNEMLKQMMESKGRFSIKMLNKSVFAEKHFDNDHNFLYSYLDPVSKQPRVQKIQVSVTSERELMNLLKKRHRSEEDPKQLQNFRDFLQRALALNPKDRLTPQEAMEHPFLHYQVKLD